MERITTYVQSLRTVSFWHRIPWRQLTGVLCIFAVGLCFWLDLEQSELADKMLRLHVLANSDSQEDQALKLKVRDELLVEVQPWLEQQADVSGVKEELQSRIPELTKMAEAVIEREGYSYPVHVELEETWFPTRTYEGFALPAGKYEALRIIIGEGQGKNWWCVVFPPLCLASSTETVTQEASAAGLDDQQVFLILEDSDQYVIKFRAIEIWETVKHHFE